jgi:hypothetical protein
MPREKNFRKNFRKLFFLTIFSTFLSAIWWNFLGNFATLCWPSLPWLAGPNLVALTTSDPWVGFLKFRWLYIIEFAWLHAGGSGLTEKITQNL